MYRDSLSVIPYDDMDAEIVGLCEALNSIRGIETTESCWGHGLEPCMIFFKVEYPSDLNKLLFHCFNHENYWLILADTGDPVRSAKDAHYILMSDIRLGDVYDVRNNIDNLCRRINERIDSVNMTDEEWRALKDE